MRWLALAPMLALLACNDAAKGSNPESPVTVAATAASTSSSLATSTSQPPATSDTTSAATSSAPPTAAPASTTVAEVTEGIEIGQSLEGRPIIATRRGTPGGTPVLVIGVIHGNEDAGTAVVDDLMTADVPEGIDLWLIESINPDGVANDVRGNANGVDLNRNFPHDWQPIAQPGDWQYSGSGPASEPETQALINFSNLIQPRLTVWYHQDLYRISPGTGLDGLIRARYAELTGLPLLRVTGGTYTGVAATWQRRTLPDAIAFIVELGETLTAEDAARHAAAVLDVAQLIPPSAP